MAAARAAMDNAPVAAHATIASDKPAKAITNVDLTDTQIEAAIARGKKSRKVQPHAASARYDQKLRQIVVKYTNGTTFSFPPALVQGLSGGSAEQLANIRISGKGYGLHWDALDVDLSVPGLIDYVFGSRKLMAQHAGQAKSHAKSKAARANGAKGGRPRKPRA